MSLFLFSQLKETKVQRACAFNLGAAYVEAGKPQKGLDFLSRAEPGERGERVADLQFNLAAAHEALKDHAQAVRHYLQAAQLYRSQGDGSSEGDTCIKLAHCHLHQKEWAEAAESYLRAAESYKVGGKPASAAVALKDAGNHMLQCDCFTSDDVIGVLTECLELSANITEQETLGKLYNAVGLSFSQLKLFPEATECYELALPLVRSTPRRLAVVLQNLGAVHNILAQYQQALEYHREAAALHDSANPGYQYESVSFFAMQNFTSNHYEWLSLATAQSGSLGSRRAQGRCFCNLGYALSELGELEEAGESYLHAQQAFKDSDDSSGQWQACEGLAGIKMRMRDPEKAIIYYKQALALLSKCKFPQLNNFLVSDNYFEHFVDSAKEWRPKEMHGRRKPHAEQPTCLNALPEANRNLNNTYEKPDVHYQNPTDSNIISQQDQPICDGSKQKQDELTSSAADSSLRAAVKLSSALQLLLLLLLLHRLKISTLIRPSAPSPATTHRLWGSDFTL
ncbi:hypothetical protein NFI96_003994 [Prochilodus magdalenae]|nr:hypothetical protein NFI96_003994 [Prochilodus magdalenae]